MKSRTDSIHSKLMNLHGNGEPTIEGLIRVYNDDPDLFFALSMEQVEESASAWLAGLGRLAQQLRQMVLRGFEIRRRNANEGEILGAGHTVIFDSAMENTIQSFMRSLNGTAVGRKGQDYRGTAMSETEMLFRLGDPVTWAAEQAELLKRVETVPLVLRIGDDDKDALTSGTPAYAIYSLQRLAPRVVAAPHSVYRGLRQSGPLKNGLAFCGHPKFALGNDAKALDARTDNMMFVVYADQEGYVFDWDWVKTDAADPSSPHHNHERFGERMNEAPPAMLIGTESLVQGPFCPQAWWSSRGDCVFYYISDAPSFAQWVNDDLTVFWSFADDSIMTGCKVKNISRLLQNREASKAQKKKGYLPLVYFLGRSLSMQSLNGHTRHYGELVQRAEQSGTEVQVEVPPQQEHTLAGC
jgi:hypothetical protein